jgi:hypothetical protein
MWIDLAIKWDSLEVKPLVFHGSKITNPRVSKLEHAHMRDKAN